MDLDDAAEISITFATQFPSGDEKEAKGKKEGRKEEGAEEREAGDEEGEASAEEFGAQEHVKTGPTGRKRKTGKAPSRKSHLYPHFKGARGPAADGTVLMGRKLLRTWEGTRGCLQSKHYAAAKRQLGELPAPELLPLGLRQGADPATIRREFKGAEFAALAEHATDLPAQPVYFNPCWEKTPRWSAPLRDSAIRLDTRLILGGPQGLSDPRSWFCEQAPPALLLRELVVIGGDLVPSSSCPDPGQIWPAALWKNRRGRWVEKGFPISILGPNDVYTPGRDGLAFMKTAPPG